LRRNGSAIAAAEAALSLVTEKTVAAPSQQKVRLAEPRLGEAMV
jgi:hypothetical protein